MPVKIIVRTIFRFFGSLFLIKFAFAITITGLAASRQSSTDGLELFAAKGEIGISTASNQTNLTKNSSVYVEDAANLYLPVLFKPDQGGWPMAGANPQRTSWVNEEVRGNLKPRWYKPFEPYIPQKVQIIAANNLLYISTAKGLYALDADSGHERWVYPTEMPLGHSPTIHKGIAYVGGFDHKLHAIDAVSGNGLWSFEAEGGFDTNPLVVDDKVYVGNRDGTFYAIYIEGSKSSQLAWKYTTAGPIHFSAAYDKGVVYFASNDSHAYALSSQSGELIWKSDKLPGSGFHSWWPVVYRDRVIFAGSHNYRFAGNMYSGNLPNTLEKQDVFPNFATDPRRTLVGVSGVVSGDWAKNTPTVDMSRPNVTPNGSTTAVTEYFEAKPWRRTYFVLNRSTGKEVTFDFDNDGKAEYAPVLWLWTHSGNRYPPIVGGDGVIYQSNALYSDPWIPGGHITGWKMDTPHFSIPNSGWNAVDEPQAFAGGGNLIYWNRCCDRVGAAFDISQPGINYKYFVYNLDEILPGYNERFYNPQTGKYTSPKASFGGPNGVYGFHGDTNPPIPYQGKVYMHRSNAVIAFGSEALEPVALPLAKSFDTQTDMANRSSSELKSRLISEVQSMLASGHLRPGYRSSGILELHGQSNCGDDLIDYWSNSSETIYTLLRALPHLPDGMKDQLRDYLQIEFIKYPPYEYNHIGWQDGSAREIFDLPQEVQADLNNVTPEKQNFTFKNSGGWDGAGVWGRNPFAFYALWKYAAEYGGAKEIYNASRDRLEEPPADNVLLAMPLVHNSYIAGYLGYLELERLAGQPESVNIKNEYIRLLQLRANNFTKDSAYQEKYKSSEGAYCRSLNVASNFMFLVPELATYLSETVLDKVQQTIAEYEQLAPYWFVTNFEDGFAETGRVHFYDYHAIFQGKALILKESRDDLAKYLDVPAVKVGDLYHIQNLISLLEASVAYSTAQLLETSANIQ